MTEESSAGFCKDCNSRLGAVSPRLWHGENSRDPPGGESCGLFEQLPNTKNREEGEITQEKKNRPEDEGERQELTGS